MATNKPVYLIIHHTGGTNQNPLQDSSYFTFEQCNELHRKEFNMKSSLNLYCGYHYYIDRQGILTQARLDTDEGAHTKGQNLSSLGICLAGNFDATEPLPAQIKTLKALLIQKAKQYGIPPSNIVPHRRFAEKTCFGNKLPDVWAADLVRAEITAIASPITALTREQRIARAKDLIIEANELLKGI